MKIFYSFKIFFIVFVLFFTGCETNNSFLSDKKLQKLVQGQWKLIPTLPNDGRETWYFEENGNLYITNDSSGITDPLRTGTYAVDGGIIESYISVSGFKTDMYNGKWLVVNVNNEVLVMNNKYRNCPGGKKKCGVYQREFTKK